MLGNTWLKIGKDVLVKENKKVLSICFIMLQRSLDPPASSADTVTVPVRMDSKEEDIFRGKSRCLRQARYHRYWPKEMGGKVLYRA
jgi:hypothetical protein